MKWIGWFLDNFWPFSKIRTLQYYLADEQQSRKAEQRSHAIIQAEYDDYKKQASWWQVAANGVLTGEQLAIIRAKIDREAEAECARIGNVVHAGQPLPVFPPKGSGKIDPGLESKDIFDPFFSPAANGVRLIAGDPTLPKMDNLQRDIREYEKLHGGPIRLGDTLQVHPSKKEDE